MILSIQPKYTMKMEVVSDSSQAEQNGTLFIISYFLITFTRMKYVYNANSQQEHQKKNRRRQEENDEEEWEEALKRLDF